MASGKLLIAENIRKLRKSHKLTQQEVADILALDRSTYTFYEIGKTNPQPESLRKLSDTYNVTIGYIYGVEKNCPEAKLGSTESFESLDRETQNLITKQERFLLMAYRSLEADKKEDFMKKVKEKKHLTNRSSAKSRV